MNSVKASCDKVALWDVFGFDLDASCLDFALERGGNGWAHAHGFVDAGCPGRPGTEYLAKLCAGKLGLLRHRASFDCRHHGVCLAWYHRPAARPRAICSEDALERPLCKMAYKSVMLHQVRVGQGESSFLGLNILSSKRGLF